MPSGAMGTTSSGGTRSPVGRPGPKRGDQLMKLGGEKSKGNHFLGEGAFKTMPNQCHFEWRFCMKFGTCEVWDLFFCMVSNSLGNLQKVKPVHAYGFPKANLVYSTQKVDTCSRLDRNP